MNQIVAKQNGIIGPIYCSLPDNKLIIPCPWGLRCNKYPKCQYWHNDNMKIVPLCQYGQKCFNKGKKCFLSHDILNENTPVCKYGLSCYTNGCTKIHPIEANKVEMGKCYLLHRAVQCTINLNPKIFNIIIYDSKCIKTSVLEQNFCLNTKIKMTVDRYIFTPNHIYQIFSNKFIGGGILGHGNVQEEKIMMHSSILQYLLHGINHANWSPLSNNLEYDPIIIDMAIVAKDNSYSGYKNNLDSPHYGTNGLMIAHDKQIADSLYEPIDMPIFIKALCVAVPCFKNYTGICYNDSILEHIFQTLYKAFTVAIIANNAELTTTETHIHIGNIGCGAFGHNYNTIFILQYLALSCAINFSKSTKEIFVTYHTYDVNTRDQLLQTAVPTLIDFIKSGEKSIKTILSEIRQKQVMSPDSWAKKL